MKHLNRNLYLIMMGIVEVLFFTYMIVLYKKGIIEVQDFNTSCIHLAVIVIFGTIIALYKRPKSEKGNEDGFDPCLIEVPHTREGIHFEVITMLILAGAWIMAIATDRFWVFEGFFSYLGPLLMFILTIITITILLGVVYLPAFKTRMRKYTNMKQVGLDIRMYRVLAVEFALFVMMYALPLDSYDPNCLYIFPGVILVTAVIFRYLIYKARHESASNEQKKAIDGFNINEVKVPRTTLGTLIEVLVGVLVIITWVLTAINGHFTEDDGSFSSREFSKLFSLTLIIITLFTAIYRPYNMKEFGKLTNLKQVKLAISMYRLFAILLAVIMLLYSVLRFNASWLWIVLVGMLILVFLIFFILIRRARD